MRNPATMSAMFHVIINAPMIRVHLAMEGTGMMALNMSKSESLLKQTVAFHSRAKDIIPYECGVRSVRSLLHRPCAHLEEEDCCIRTKSLVDFNNIEVKASMSNQHHTASVQRGVPDLSTLSVVRGWKGSETYQRGHNTVIAMIKSNPYVLCNKTHADSYCSYEYRERSSDQEVRPSCDSLRALLESW